MANNGTIITSELTLQYIHRIDAILFLFNCFILILPFIYHLLKFILIQLKCIHQYDYRSRPIDNQINDNEIDIDDNDDECPEIGKHWQMAKSKCQTGNLNDKIHYLTNDEIIKQLIYLILLISYLFYLFELLIIDVKICQSSIFDGNFLSLELFTIILTIIIHLIHYGLFYGKYFLLNIDQYQPSGHNNYSHDQCSTIKIYDNKRRIIKQNLNNQIYLLILNYIAFNYFLLSVCLNGAKFLILFQILANDSNRFYFQLIRIYLSTIIILLQTYFVVKHWKNLLIIWKWSKNYATDNKSNADNDLPFGNDIKYRRNYSTFLSKITFFWFIPILKLGYVQNLTVPNLGILPQNERSFVQFERFYKHFNSIDVLPFSQ